MKSCGDSMRICMCRISNAAAMQLNTQNDTPPHHDTTTHDTTYSHVIIRVQTLACVVLPLAVHCYTHTANIEAHKVKTRTQNRRLAAYTHTITHTLFPWVSHSPTHISTVWEWHSCMWCMLCVCEGWRRWQIDNEGKWGRCAHSAGLALTHTYFDSTPHYITSSLHTNDVFRQLPSTEFVMLACVGDCLSWFVIILLLDARACCDEAEGDYHSTTYYHTHSSTTIYTYSHYTASLVDAEQRHTSQKSLRRGRVWMSVCMGMVSLLVHRDRSLHTHTNTYDHTPAQWPK